MTRTRATGAPGQPWQTCCVCATQASGVATEGVSRGARAPTVATGPASPRGKAAGAVAFALEAAVFGASAPTVGCTVSFHLGTTTVATEAPCRPRGTSTAARAVVLAPGAISTCPDVALPHGKVVLQREKGTCSGRGVCSTEEGLGAAMQLRGRRSGPMVEGSRVLPVAVDSAPITHPVSTPDLNGGQIGPRK